MKTYTKRYYSHFYHKPKKAALCSNRAISWGYRRLADLFSKRIHTGKNDFSAQRIFELFSLYMSSGQSSPSVIRAASLAAATTLVLSPSLATAQKEIVFSHQKPDIPLYGIDVQTGSMPAFSDIDGDGDIDVFVGNTYGSVQYYENIGNNTTSEFVEQTGTANPFNGVDVGSNSSPNFVDITGDGILDAFIGAEDGTVHFFWNTGNTANPILSEVSGNPNPLNGVDVGNRSTPDCVDIDNDGDFDVFIGSKNAGIIYFENTGTVNSPNFVQRVGGANPVNGLTVGKYQDPSFVDIDGDGDFDVLVGNGSDIVSYFKNSGTPENPSFALMGSAENPMSEIDVEGSSHPEFADIDGDGDFDIFIGEYQGTLKAYENIGSAQTPSIEPWLDSKAVMSTINVDDRSNLRLVDIDNDGDLDVFVGADDGTIYYFENTGTDRNPTFTQKKGVANPFDGVDVGGNSSPRFVDIDNDGDFDAFAGESAGNINYYENTGTRSNPIFTSMIGPTNPFNGMDVGSSSNPCFVDIDDDGDFDAFVGEAVGNINYYENVGTKDDPDFMFRLNAANPLNGVDVGVFSNPSFADIDGDGDFDAVIGEYSGTVKYYKNTGTKTAPVFVEQNGADNPFDGFNVGYASAPCFADINKDGNLEAFIGTFNGRIQYYLNEATFPWPLFLPAVMEQR